MKIKYRASKNVRDVSDAIGEALISRRIAVPYERRDMRAQEVDPDPLPAPRKKRRYRRRDMAAEA